MRPICLAVLACAFALPLPVAAQSEDNQTAAAGQQQTTENSGQQPAPEKKKGGLFGKVKGLAKNKVVQQVAKTAACTMVPGGQVIAGAIDAAGSKNAGDAATSAAGAATGSNCMPGGIGGGASKGLVGGVANGVAGGVANGVVGAAAQAAAGKAAGPALGVAIPGMPIGGAAYGSMAGIPNPEKIASCLGLSPKEFQDLVDPTHGQPRGLTNDEMKHQAELAQKIDMQRYQACMMQQMGR